LAQSQYGSKPQAKLPHLAAQIVTRNVKKAGFERHLSGFQAKQYFSSHLI
jgi:hypothetical protein